MLYVPTYWSIMDNLITEPTVRNGQVRNCRFLMSFVTSCDKQDPLSAQRNSRRSTLFTTGTQHYLRAELFGCDPKQDCNMYFLLLEILSKIFRAVPYLNKG